MPTFLSSTVFRSVVFSALFSAAFADSAAPTPDCDRFRHTGFWDIDIDNYPALPPECLAPISANADRNKAHLPAQIVGIFASYIFVAIIVGTAILSIRVKRKKRLAPKSVELKLVLTSEKHFEPSVGSPASTIASWMRNPLRKKHAQSDNFSDARSPGLDSIASFDPKVVDDDRETRQAEMERLYAAVMAHDEARRSQLSQVTANLNRTGSVTSTIASRPQDKRLAHVTQHEIPRSPISPIRAIYPPGHSLAGGMSMPLSPTSPIHTRIPELPSSGLLSPTTPISPTALRADLPDDMYPASPPPGTRRMRFPNQPQYTHGPLSPDRVFTPATIMSPGAPKTPVLPQTPLGARTPLPYDMYPASPTVPEQYDTLYPPEKAPSTSSKASKDSKGRRLLKNIRINTNLRGDEDAEDRAPLSATYQQEQLEQPSPTSAETQESSDANEKRWQNTTPRRPPNLKIPSANASLVSLPSGPQQAVPNPPKSAMGSGPRPLALRVAFPDEDIKSPVVKTTVLQQRKDILTRGPRTARTPMTGVPQTPYTPYMPFTPITPITPHLVTRGERRALKKMEGKTLLDESDLVKEEDEDWE